MEKKSASTHPPPHLIIYLFIYITVTSGAGPWERSEAGGVNDNERHLRHSPVSSPTALGPAPLVTITFIYIKVLIYLFILN